MLATFHLAVLVAMIVAGSVSSASAQVDAIWTAGDGEKIRIDAKPKRAEPLSLFGMRNETVAFQVVVRAGAEGASDVSLAVEFADLTLDAAQIEVFREDYIEVHERSQDLVWQPKSNAEPAVESGSVCRTVSRRRRNRPTVRVDNRHAKAGKNE